MFNVCLVTMVSPMMSLTISATTAEPDNTTNLSLESASLVPNLPVAVPTTTDSSAFVDANQDTPSILTMVSAISLAQLDSIMIPTSLVALIAHLVLIAVAL
jgi:hypothetical protein